MRNDLSNEQVHDILKALDDLIKSGSWEQSGFLRAVGKNLAEIRERFANEIALYQKKKAEEQPSPNNRKALHVNQQEVFISLYTSEGNMLQAWERLIVNLARQVISRPIYSKEEDIKTLIKSKENKINEAYVSVYVNNDDILPLPQDKVHHDKFGVPLLSLKDNAIKFENINYFVHYSGHYTYSKGRLIRDMQVRE